MANPCGDDVLVAMEEGLLGYIDTPLQQNATASALIHEAGVVWCADNGCFSARWDESRWWAFLEKNAEYADTCLFAVAPDVVGDAYETTVRFRRWGARIRQLGYKVAYVAQDGIEGLRGNTVDGGLTFPVPWSDFDALFIGGSTEFKLGPVVVELCAEAKRRGKWVHVGRVNSKKRFDYCRDVLHADSVDGTYLTFGPKVNLPKLLSWTGAPVMMGATA